MLLELDPPITVGGGVLNRFGRGNGRGFFVKMFVWFELNSVKFNDLFRACRLDWFWINLEVSSNILLFGNRDFIFLSKVYAGAI